MTKLSTKGFSNMSYLLCFLCLAGILPRAVQAESVMGFAYDGVTTCSSSVVEMNSLSFDCNEDAGCTLGDDVTITGECKSQIVILSTVFTMLN